MKIPKTTRSECGGKSLTVSSSICVREPDHGNHSRFSVDRWSLSVANRKLFALNEHKEWPLVSVSPPVPTPHNWLPVRSRYRQSRPAHCALSFSFFVWQTFYCPQMIVLVLAWLSTRKDKNNENRWVEKLEDVGQVSSTCYECRQKPLMTLHLSLRPSRLIHNFHIGNMRAWNVDLGREDICNVVKFFLIMDHAVNDCNSVCDIIDLSGDTYNTDATPFHLNVSNGLSIRKKDDKRKRWIPMCRTKLRDRELMLIEKRQQKCRDVVTLSIDQFTRQNFRYFLEVRGKKTIRVERMDKVNREMMNHYLNPQTHQHTIDSCSAALSESLGKWEGVRKSTKFTKKDSVAFNVYFRTAKNWFDQCKVTLLSEVYWIPIFVVTGLVWCIILSEYSLVFIPN